MAFSVFLKNIREEKELTQQELADALDASLPNIKTIEAGRTVMPGTKLLESLSDYLQKPQALVLHEIIFDNPKEYENEIPLHLQHYITWKYVEGYTFDLLPEFQTGNKDRPRKYYAVLTKKREAQVKILLDDIFTTKGFGKIREVPADDDLFLVIIDKLLLLIHVDDAPKFREHKFVLDANDKLHVELFKAYKRLTTEFIKSNLIMELFDYKKYEVTDTLVISGTEAV